MYLFEPAPGGKSSLNFVKAKNKEKLKFLNFPLSKSKTILPVLVGIFFEFSFWRLLFDRKMKMFANFLNNYLFLRSL